MLTLGTAIALVFFYAPIDVAFRRALENEPTEAGAVSAPLTRVPARPQ